ncbi:MAG: hypothetical protein R3A10_02720 [Caldilineaceae bacterium]
MALVDEPCARCAYNSSCPTIAGSSWRALTSFTTWGGHEHASGAHRGGQDLAVRPATGPAVLKPVARQPGRVRKVAKLGMLDTPYRGRWALS